MAPFMVMDVMERVREMEASGRDVVHLEVGQPSTPAPRLAREAVVREMSGDPMGYTVALGVPELREAIADLYRRRHGLTLDPARVIVTNGSSGAFVLAFLSLFDAGDRVAIADPGYPSYRNILKALNVEPVRIEAHAESRWQPTPADLGEADGMLVASPANPTGTMLGRAELSALASACAARGAGFVSDEIYHGLSWTGPSVSALEVTDDVVVINSFSKYWSMTGWRVGWMVVPPDLVRTVERLAQNLFICAPHVSQIAALAALSAEEECQANVAVYERNRTLLMNELPAAGFTELAPADGAFYLYADVRRLTDDSRAFCDRMLKEAGVAAVPGHDFDPVRGKSFVRFSFARDEAHIAEGARRLRSWLAG